MQHLTSAIDASILVRASSWPLSLNSCVLSAHIHVYAVLVIVCYFEVR